MFFHNFKYSFKILLKNKTLVFWSIIWPLVLGTLFYMAFSNMVSKEKLEIINIGIVQSENYENNIYLKSTLEELSNSKNEDQLFNVTYDNKNKLNDLLDNKDIDAFIDVSDNVEIITKENGLNQTIVKNVVDEIEQYKLLTTTLTEKEIELSIEKGEIPDPTAIATNIITKLSTSKEYLNNVSSKNMDYMMIEYYTLLAMTCLYGALLSSEVIKNYLGNLNRKGSRISLTKAKRITLIFSGLLSSFIIQLITIGLLLIYTKFILDIDYGPKTALVLLLSIIGSLAGLCLGLFVGSIPYKNDGTRIGITNIVVMLGCFLQE